MKKLLTIIAIVLPSLSWGQINISLIGGGATPIMTGMGKNAAPIISPTASIKASYQFNSLSAGIRFDYGIASYKLKDGAYSYDTTTGFYNREAVTVKYLNPAFGISAFLEKSFSKNVVSPFIGINAGYVVSSPSEIIYPDGDKKVFNSVNCFGFGAQFGLKIRLSNSFSLIAESSPKVLIPTNEDNVFFVIPLEAGISLSI